MTISSISSSGWRGGTAAPLNTGPVWQLTHLPLPLKISMPATCWAVIAAVLPRMYLSNGEWSEISVRS